MLNLISIPTSVKRLSRLYPRCELKFPLLFRLFFWFDASFSTAKEIADDLNKLQNHIHSYLPECLVIISSPINRLDDHKKAITIRNVNVILKNMSEISLIDNNNIIAKHLGKRKLHLNISGSTILARNILDKLRSI